MTASNKNHSQRNNPGGNVGTGMVAHDTPDTEKQVINSDTNNKNNLLAQVIGNGTYHFLKSSKHETVEWNLAQIEYALNKYGQLIETAILDKINNKLIHAWSILQNNKQMITKTNNLKGNIEQREDEIGLIYASINDISYNESIRILKLGYEEGIKKELHE